ACAASEKKQTSAAARRVRAVPGVVSMLNLEEWMTNRWYGAVPSSTGKRDETRSVGRETRPAGARRAACSGRRQPVCLVGFPQDPRALDHHVAGRDAVARQLPPLGIDDLHLDAVQRPPLLQRQRKALVGRQIAVLGLRAAYRPDRAHLGHAPAMRDADAEIVAQGPDHRRRASRPADRRLLEGRELEIVLLHVLDQA